jgi:hypothetical protein
MCSTSTPTSKERFAPPCRLRNAHRKHLIVDSQSPQARKVALPQPHAATAWYRHGGVVADDGDMPQLKVERSNE